MLEPITEAEITRLQKVTEEDLEVLTSTGVIKERPIEKEESAPRIKKKTRRRRRVKRKLPEPGTFFRATYFGQEYYSKIIVRWDASKRRHRKKIVLLNGPNKDCFESSMTGAMKNATAKQREEQDLGGAGMSNGWTFWNEVQNVETLPQEIIEAGEKVPNLNSFGPPYKPEEEEDSDNN